MERQPRTTDISIEELLDGIRAGHIALADFQRDFDWTPRAVRSLLATVLMGWPAGSLLAVSGNHPEMQTRPFEGGPPLKSEVSLVILDGQQRLTALLHSLWPRDGEPAIALPLGAFKRNSLDDIEEALGSPPAVEQQVGLPGTEELLVPLSAGRDREAFTTWRDTVQHRDDLAYDLANAYRDHLHWLHDYRFPVVTLDASINAGSVARIFERVNRSGLRLGSFDLVVARTHSAEWHLRERWEDARLEFPLLEAFYGDDGLPILQSIALQHSADVRQSAILELDADIVLERWQPALVAMDRALRFLVSECGVRRTEWLPYRALPLVLGGLLLEAEFGDHRIPRLLDRRGKQLAQWALSRAFSLRYDAAVNTRVVEDFRELRDALLGSRPWPATPPAVASQVMVSTKQRQGAIYRAFACVLALNNAQDVAYRPFRTADLPVAEPEASEPGELALLTPLLPRGPRGHHLRALNMVLAHPTTAAALHRRQRVGGATPLPLDRSDELIRALNSQFLPKEDLRHHDGEELLSFRLLELGRWLRVHLDQEVEF